MPDKDTRLAVYYLMLDAFECAERCHRSSTLCHTLERVINEFFPKESKWIWSYPELWSQRTNDDPLKYWFGFWDSQIRMECLKKAIYGIENVCAS